MDNGYFILMMIFGVSIFLYGLDICVSKNPVLPIRYHGKRTRSYLKYLGKTTMTISIAPILSGLVSLLGDSGIIVLLSGLTLILSFIVGIIISIKVYKED